MTKRKKPGPEMPPARKTDDFENTPFENTPPEDVEEPTGRIIIEGEIEKDIMKNILPPKDRNITEEEE